MQSMKLIDILGTCPWDWTLKFDCLGYSVTNDRLNYSVLISDKVANRIMKIIKEATIPVAQLP